MKLLQNSDDGVDRVVLLRLVSQSRLVPCDAPNRDDNHSNQSEHAQAFLCDAVEHQAKRHNHNRCIENVEAVHEEASPGGKGLEDDLDQENCEEDQVDLTHDVVVKREKR